MKKRKPTTLRLWDYGTELWVVYLEDYTICPARVVDITFDEHEKKCKHFVPIYTLVWSGLLWRGPNNTFVYDNAYLFERTPEGTKAAQECLHKVILDAIEENDKELTVYKDVDFELNALLNRVCVGSCFSGVSTAEQRKLAKLLEAN